MASAPKGFSLLLRILEDFFREAFEEVLKCRNYSTSSTQNSPSPVTWRSTISFININTLICINKYTNTNELAPYFILQGKGFDSKGSHY